jgi:hypothetical protein
MGYGFLIFAIREWNSDVPPDVPRIFSLEGFFEFAIVGFYGRGAQLQAGTRLSKKLLKRIASRP